MNESDLRTGGLVLDYLLAPENVTFALAAGLLAVISVLQVASFLLGFAPLSGVDDWLGGDLDLSVDHTPTFGEALLSLIGVGKVPVVFSFLFFLFAYACIGYGLQWVIGALGFGLWPAWLASLAAFVVSLPVLRGGNEVLGKLIPGDESLAVSEATFIGKLAVVTLGTATYRRSAEAKLEDDHGRTQYVQVVSDLEEESFRAGEEVVIVGKRGSEFTVVRGPAALLLEE